MQKNDLVVLVPGLLGFGELQIGPQKISYFDKVAKFLAFHAQVPVECFQTFPISPTAPLRVRAKELLDYLNAQLDKDHPLGGPINRIHLIGHSTGGVDIRLLLNSNYKWEGFRPSEAALQRVWDRVGHAIALSAPLKGTPIARRLNGSFSAALPLLFAAAIFSRLGYRVELYYATAELLALSTLNTVAPGTAVARYFNALPKTVANRAVADYLDKIVKDNRLINDLTAIKMKALNKELKDGDRKKLKCFVSVSPAPSAPALFDFINGQQTLTYWFAWDKTRSGEIPEERGHFPHGNWIVPASHSIHDDSDSDGVVPAWSQTVDGTATWIVEGDHLDVVGHYESGALYSDAVLKSGSGFDNERFNLLWARIAAELV